MLFFYPKQFNYVFQLVDEKNHDSFLDSISQQTYQNLEIICVDDCSTDGSFSFLQTYARQEPRLRVLQRTENGGQAAARQTGIDAATGDYIGFVDRDDWIDPDYYEKMMKKALQDQTDIVVNPNILVHEGDRGYPKDFPGHQTLEQRVYHHPSHRIENFYCVVWNKIFRTEFLKQRKYTIPVRSAHEDLFFHYATFAFAKDVSFFDGPAYHYLLRENSISNVSHDWGTEHIRVFSQIYDFYKDNNLLDKRIKLYATMPFFVIKTAEMFQVYHDYFKKVLPYFKANADVFPQSDLFIAEIITKYDDYETYKAHHSSALIMLFLRRKR